MEKALSLLLKELKIPPGKYEFKDGNLFTD